MANKSKQADLDFDPDLFKSADKMRGGLEPSEHKHVALVLIFLQSRFFAMRVDKNWRSDRTWSVLPGFAQRLLHTEQPVESR